MLTLSILIRAQVSEEDLLPARSRKLFNEVDKKLSDWCLKQT